MGAPPGKWWRPPPRRLTWASKKQAVVLRRRLLRGRGRHGAPPLSSSARTAHADRRGRARLQAPGPDRLPAPLAAPVAAVAEPLLGPGDLGQVLAGLAEQSRHVLPVERGRRALGVVLVIGGRVRGRDDALEVPPQGHDPGFGARPFRVQPGPRGRPLRRRKTVHVPCGPVPPARIARAVPAASRSMISPAGRSAALRNPRPAYRLIRLVSPAAAAAARIGRVALLISG